MSKDPKVLYQRVIMAHNRDPVSFEKVEGAAVVLEAYNPLCGDKFTLYLDIEEDRVTDVHFYGYGCAISKASTSVLVERIKGRRLSEVWELIESFDRLLHSEEETADETLQAFTAAREFPARLQCVTLSWEALGKYLREKD